MVETVRSCGRFLNQNDSFQSYMLVLLNTAGYLELEQMTLPGQIRSRDPHFNARFRPLKALIGRGKTNGTCSHQGPSEFQQFSYMKFVKAAIVNRPIANEGWR